MLCIITVRFADDLATLLQTRTQRILLDLVNAANRSWEILLKRAGRNLVYERMETVVIKNEVKERHCL